MTDYLIVMAQRNSAAVAEAFSAIRPNNPMCDELFKILEKPYDKEEWRHLSANTDLFKLTWKQYFPSQAEGVATFYAELINGGLVA